MGDPDTGGGTTAASYTALAEVKNRFNDLAAALRNVGTPLGRSHDTALDGAGQFTTELRPGAVAFLLSWREVFGVCSESAGLIAGNTGKTAVDLKALDVDASTTIQL